MTDHFTLIQGVHCDDELQLWGFGSDPEQSWNVRKRADNRGQLAMVDDVLGRLRPEGFVEGDWIQ